MTKHLFLLIVIWGFLACKNNSDNEAVLRNAKIVNEGLMEIIDHDIRLLSAYTSEHEKAKSYTRDALFYYNTSKKLLQSGNDSTLLWELTQSPEALRYGYSPILQENDLKSDSITRYSIITLNLHNYMHKLHNNFSICPPLYHIIPLAESDYEYSIYGMENYNPVLEDIALVGQRMQKFETPIPNKYHKVAELHIHDTSLVNRALEKSENETIIK